MIHFDSLKLKNIKTKDTEKKFVGQPIFKQLIAFLPKNKIDVLISNAKADRYYKGFTTWNQMITLLFGVLSRCDSMG